jgi:hypothetical protein
MLAAVVAAFLMSASVASAATAPGYEEFGDCPSKNVDSSISGCIVTTITGGHLQMGTKDTPITDPIVLTVGINGSNQIFVGDFDGGRQQVPGGIIGITGLDWLGFLFPFSALRLYAEAELAGTPTNPFGPLGLPLKVRLDSTILSSNCYIGSNTNPIQLNLTTDTTNPPPPNQPISGTQGTITFDPNLAGVFRSNGNVLVDNAFAVPAASGCGILGIGLIDALVNLQAGLPSPAGTNETTQNGTAAIGVIENIYPPGGFE